LSPDEALREARDLVQKLNPQERSAKRTKLPAARRPLFDLLLKTDLTAAEETQLRLKAPALLNALRQQ
jgi:hypothetical protein